MSAENNKEAYLGLQNDLEVVRKWPLFSAINNLHEQIFSLGYCVGGHTRLAAQDIETHFIGKESQIFISTLLENQRLKYGDRADRAIRNLLGTNPSKLKGHIRRETDNGILTTKIFIFTDLDNPDSLFLTFKQNPNGDCVTLSTTEINKLDIDDNSVSIYDYKPVLEGLNRILEYRKQFKSYLTASA